MRQTNGNRPMNLKYPFTGHWLVQNSHANRVPNHGTGLFASAYAIDFVPVTSTGRSAPITLSSLLAPEPATRFPGFGRTVLAPADGRIIATQSDAPDHDAHRGLPSIRYALTQRRRVAGGWQALAGNHVLLECEGVVVALCHLQQHSITVQPNQSVRSGEALGRCGNSGNSTEPHLHIQAFDHPDVTRAKPVLIMFEELVPRNGVIVNATPHTAS